jgi:hypothetical protein
MDETAQVTAQVTELSTEMQRLLHATTGEMASRDIQERLGLKHREHFRKVYVVPALAAEGNGGGLQTLQGVSPRSLASARERAISFPFTWRQVARWYLSPLGVRYTIGEASESGSGGGVGSGGTTSGAGVAVVEGDGADGPGYG